MTEENVQQPKIEKQDPIPIETQNVSNIAQNTQILPDQDLNHEDYLLSVGEAQKILTKGIQEYMEYNKKFQEIQKEIENIKRATYKNPESRSQPKTKEKNDFVALSEQEQKYMTLYGWARRNKFI